MAVVVYRKTTPFSDNPTERSFAGEHRLCRGSLSLQSARLDPNPPLNPSPETPFPPSKPEGLEGLVGILTGLPSDPLLKVFNFQWVKLKLPLNTEKLRGWLGAMKFDRWTALPPHGQSCNCSSGNDSSTRTCRSRSCPQHGRLFTGPLATSYALFPPGYEGKIKKRWTGNS